MKLAGFLASTPAAMTRAAKGPKTLFLLDEPTTGLHPQDVAKLLETLTRLLDLGQFLILVEHALEVLRAADWIIDIGPEAGDRGGEIVAEGTPEDVSKPTPTPVGRWLACSTSVEAAIGVDRRIARSIFVGWAEWNEAHQAWRSIGWWASFPSTHPTRSGRHDATLQSSCRGRWLAGISGRVMLEYRQIPITRPKLMNVLRPFRSG